MPVSPSRRDGFELEAFVPYRLSIAAERVSRAFAARYADDFGLSVPEWRVMAHVGAAGELSAADVARRTGMDKAKVSRSVARLVEAGLLDARPDDGDRRVVVLRLTRAGRGVYAKIVDRAVDLEDELRDALGAEEYERLRRSLVRLEAKTLELSGGD